MRPDCTDFHQLFLEDRPLMDARAPVEYAKGAFPLAINLPLMNDLERQKVGTCYKNRGQDAAIALGHQLVSGQTKTARIEAWAAFARANPHGYLYCFRGGLRSQIVQQWLRDEAGIAYPRVIGGYKALRGFLMQSTLEALGECAFTVVGGLTGTGKTEVLAHLDNAIDLEGHANHRGSAFGKRAIVQPGQIDFENRLAVDLLKKRARGHRHFVIEDESRLVGACSLPLELHQAMQQLPLVWLEDSFEGRVQRILKDYVVDLAAEFVALHGAERGMTLYAERLRRALAGIVKRLGGERYSRLAQIMDGALVEQAAGRGVQQHEGWIAALLAEYYDPMYAYQREQKAARIVFAGDRESVLGYLRERHFSQNSSL